MSATPESSNLARWLLITVNTWSPYRVRACAMSWKIEMSWMLWEAAVEAISARFGSGTAFPSSSRQTSSGLGSRLPGELFAVS